MSTPTYEHYFITLDKAVSSTGRDLDVRFNLIEDESGDIFWGYGHQEADEFTAEINRWWEHTGAVTAPEDLIQVGTPVEHLWAHSYDDEFRLCDKDADDAFPVTRLAL